MTYFTSYEENQEIIIYSLKLFFKGYKVKYQLDCEVKNFGEKILELSGEDVSKCYQCGKCTAGCPVAYEMKETPNQIIRLIQLGQSNEVFRSSTIWLCASCETCTTRCPKGIDIAGLMDTMRILAVEEGYLPAEKNVAVFNNIFLDLVKKRGIVAETLLAIRYNITTRHFFQDAKLGLRLFQKGKISPVTHKTAGIEEISNIYARSKAFVVREKME